MITVHIILYTFVIFSIIEKGSFQIFTVFIVFQDFFFFFAILVPFLFNNPAIYAKNLAEILVGIVLNLCINVGRIDLYTVNTVCF